MRIVIALGGNALLRRGEPLTAENQRRNIAMAAACLAPIARDHALIITHGNGPQVGLLALQSAAGGSSEAYPLDVLDAETEARMEKREARAVALGAPKEALVLFGDYLRAIITADRMLDPEDKAILISLIDKLVRNG